MAKFINEVSDANSIREKIGYPDPLLKALSVLTGDSRFETLKGNFKEGESSMCEILDKVEYENSKSIAIRMIKDGMRPSDVSKYIPNLSKDDIQDIFNNIFKNPEQKKS